MNKTNYAQFMGEIRAPKSLVEKAILAMYDSEAEREVFANKPKYKRCFGVAAIAAVLCLVLLAGIICYPTGSEGENVFVINAGAAEINSFEPVKLGELKCEFSSLELCFNDANELTGVTMSEFLNFPVSCIGKNVESVTYSVKGKGFFVVNDSDTMIYDKQYYEDSTVTVCADEETVSSFTTDFTDCIQNVKLCLFTRDVGADYCNSYNFIFGVNKDEKIFGKGFDYQQMYYDLFTTDEYFIEIEAKFKDSTTQIKTLDLIIDKADEEKASEQNTTLIVSAKLAE